MTKLYKLCLALVLLLSVQANAQYYYVPNIGAGTNPGGLNTDSEYPLGGGLPSGWQNIRAASATPAWSVAQTIPFAFNFNNVAVTQYKVSTTGVLTFDVAAATAPPVANTALPSTSVPNSSICVWGINGTGSNDYVVKKTFGTAPNRQHWVCFSSYTAGSCAYTYWSIVLEETTNKIYIVDQRNSGASCQTNFGVTVGVQVDATNFVNVNGSPNVNCTSASDFTPADNSYYEFIYGTQPAVQTKMKSVSVTKYVVVPGTSTVTGIIQNLGANTLTSADITYRVNGVDYTTTLSGLSVAPYASYNFSHPTSVNVNTPIPYNVKAWVSTVGDADNSDDTLSASISGLAFLPTKRVLIEEGTGTWCQWCPRGAVYTEQIDTVYLGTAIVVAVHNSDPMADPTYDAGLGTLIGGYPSGAVDRKEVDVDPTDFETSYLNLINDVPPADVNLTATYDPATSIATVTVTAVIAGELTGDYRLNAIMVEDDVTGTTSGYNQVNAYSGGAAGALSGAGHDWHLEPNPVPAADMHYDFVGRAILGGFEGQIGSLPSTLMANNSYSYSFAYTVPNTYDVSQMRAIAVLIDGSNGQILNANRGFYGITTSVKTVTAPDFTMGLFPNPANDFAQLELNLVRGGSFTVEVINVIGQTVHRQQITGSNGMNVIGLPVSQFNDGVYMVRVSMNGSQLTQRLIVK
jgi:hypothetical protein